ncbi:DUF3800 domain-containing protein [Desulfovibrio desulfuricans]|uniref:DUF3800 domain-containing protein n=1 Tax=Desulfovibrio desulfuricans TaxID=876 RepID=UPI0035B2B9F2
MNYEIYCDENFPDLFNSEKPKARHMLIGGIWIPSEFRSVIKKDIVSLREKHATWGEIKWTKVSPTRINFYIDLIELFFSYPSDVKFRCIAIDRNAYDSNINNGDNELGFYKFYYQLLHHWICDGNDYSIFCDTKTNRDKNRLKVLSRCLQSSNQSAKIQLIQSLPSKQVVAIQLCDLLLGAVSGRINQTISPGAAKEQLVHLIEKRLGVRELSHTARDAKKFNIFRINLQRGRQ